jgi:3-oxoacyl-[acyl-carrier-protein] synthase III
MQAKITGTGSYVPAKIVTNEDIALRVDIDPKWVAENLGIERRRVKAEYETTSDMATTAAIRALGKARVSVDQVDLIIVATATPDKLSPSTACIVQGKLGAKNAVAFDINAVCSGFVFALQMAAQCIELGTYKRALVIGADSFSSITDWKSKTCTFFGDGAGAVVLELGFKKHFLGTVLGSDGGGQDFFATEHAGTFTINGKSLYDAACTVLPAAMKAALEKAQLTAADIDHIIPHQASKKLLLKLCELSGVGIGKLRTNMKDYGNTAAATVPLLLDQLNSAGELRKNDIIMFSVFGSGITWGACLYEW